MLKGKVYKTIMHAQMEHQSTVRDPYTTTNIKTLEIAQLKALK